VHPLVLAVFGVKPALQHPPHLEGKLRAQFLQLCALHRLSEFVAMVTHENEVALVVHRNHFATSELRVVWEERAEQATHSVSESSGESIQDHFRDVKGCRPVVLNVLAEFHVGNLLEGTIRFGLVWFGLVSNNSDVCHSI
jgi:hypothetical protein